MSQDLTAKQRDAALRQWRSLIARECGDLDSLERIGARAVQDRDVRADAQLLSMVQAELDRRRAELQREQQSEQRRQASSKPPLNYRSSALRRDESGWRSNHDSYPESRPAAQMAPRDPAPSAPDPDRIAVCQLVADLSEALKNGDEDAARTVCAQLRTLHGRRSEIVSAADLERYEQRIEKLRARLEGFRGTIDTMAREAVAAARRGDAETAVKLMRRLSSIHVVHPRLLDEPGLEEIRRDLVGANESREDRLTTHRLLERERAVAAKMKRLAAAVNDFHRIVLTVPEMSAEFLHAEKVYLQALQEDRLHEEDWLAEFVLELADVLAEWGVPPPGAEQQIDRFLERVRVGIERIHKKMGDIDSERGGVSAS